MNLQLGRLPKRHDPRNLLLSTYLRLPTAPPTQAYGSKVKKWGVLLNDQLPDCTAAAVGHHVQLHAINTPAADYVPSDEAALSFFDLTGRREGLGRNDGRSMLDCMKAWRDVGFGGHTSFAFAEVDMIDDAPAALWMFGGLQAGFNLPISAYDQWRAGKNWSIVSGPRGEAGTWGGHAVVCSAYNKTGPICITWGKRKQMTWAFWRRYADERYAVLSLEWASPSFQSPPGFNLNRLKQDLANL
jgi:hypothetical protein